MRKGLDYPINLIIISLLYGIVAYWLFPEYSWLINMCSYDDNKLSWEVEVRKHEMTNGHFVIWPIAASLWNLNLLSLKTLNLTLKRCPEKADAKMVVTSLYWYPKPFLPLHASFLATSPFTKPNLDLTTHKYRYWARSQTAQDHNGSGQAQDYMFYSPPFIAHTSTIIQRKLMAMSGICEPFTNKQGTHY